MNLIFSSLAKIIEQWTIRWTWFLKDFPGRDNKSSFKLNSSTWKHFFYVCHHLFESDVMSNMANPLEMKIKTQDQV
jgi:hypothetical protein